MPRSGRSIVNSAWVPSSAAPTDGPSARLGSSPGRSRRQPATLGGRTHDRALNDPARSCFIDVSQGIPCAHHNSLPATQPADRRTSSVITKFTPQPTLCPLRVPVACIHVFRCQRRDGAERIGSNVRRNRRHGSQQHHSRTKARQSWRQTRWSWGQAGGPFIAARIAHVATTRNAARNQSAFSQNTSPVSPGTSPHPQEPAEGPPPALSPQGLSLGPPGPALPSRRPLVLLGALGRLLRLLQQLRCVLSYLPGGRLQPPLLSRTLCLVELAGPAELSTRLSGGAHPVPVA